MSERHVRTATRRWWIVTAAGSIALPTLVIALASCGPGAERERTYRSVPGSATVSVVIPAESLPAPAADSAGHRALPSLGELAAAWSAGVSRAVCQDETGMAELPARFRVQNCSWPSVTRGREFGVVSGKRRADGVLHAVIWQRTLADGAAAARLADSLSTALHAYGLTQYGCPNAGRRWQRPGFVLEYTRGVVRPDGLLPVVVVATTMPGAIPSLTCPDAPRLPRPHPAAGG